MAEKTFDDLYAESSTSATFTLGFDKKDGRLIVTSHETDQYGRIQSWGSLYYDGKSGELRLGDKQMGLPGKLIIGTVGDPEHSIYLNGETCTLTMGGVNCGYGTIRLNNLRGEVAATMSAETATLTLGPKAAGSSEQADGRLYLQSRNGVTRIALDGAAANAVLGGDGQDGDVVLKTATGVPTISLDAGSGTCAVGGSGVGGNLSAISTAGHETLSFDANNALLTVGGEGANGDIYIRNSSAIETIKITGSNGDIEFLNADIAEEFDIAQARLDDAAPGTVMVLDTTSALVPCECEYDHRVVGVIAGAGSYRPGIVLDRTGRPNRRPVALMGKVYCFVDADAHPVEVGDLLTTSRRPGHAMKAVDSARAFGSVIGKALARLTRGTGLIPVLVKPQ